MAVLVAVSIPIFTSQLEKSREATDMANIRSAKAAFVSMYLTDRDSMGTTYFYDIQKGQLVTDDTTSTSKMKGTAINPGTFTETNNEYKYKSAEDYSGGPIKITFTKGTDGAPDSYTWSFGGKDGATITLDATTNAS